MSNKKTVFIQNWTERERGWGQRPDGFTVHTSKLQLESYIKWYHDTFNNTSEIPDEYTTVDSAPIEIEVSDDLYEHIHEATQKTVDCRNRKVGCVHGKEKYFSTSPMRELKATDIRW